MSSSSKRKQKNAIVRTPIPGGMAAAVHWPFYEVMVSQNWEDEAALVTVLVARRAPTGKIAAASFLVDLGCLGVKSAQVRLFPTVHDYDQQLRGRLLSGQPMAHADLNLAAKIIRTGLDYAGNLGFKPDPVCYQALYILTGADPDACAVPVPVGGADGKPFFVSGPYDDALRIVQHLTQRLGEGNFHYMVALSDDVEILDDLE